MAHYALIQGLTLAGLALVVGGMAAKWLWSQWG